MKIKIISAYSDKCWYRDEIDNMFEVNPQPTEVNSHQSYLIIERGETTRKAVNVEDVEIILL